MELCMCVCGVCVYVCVCMCAQDLEGPTGEDGSTQAGRVGEIKGGRGLIWPSNVLIGPLWPEGSSVCR